MTETGVVDAAQPGRPRTSAPIPSSPFAARGSLDAGLAERLKDAFLEAHTYMSVEMRKELIGGETNRYVAADDTLYDPIRETAQDPEPGPDPDPRLAHRLGPPREEIPPGRRRTLV